MTSRFSTVVWRRERPKQDASARASYRRESLSGAIAYLRLSRSCSSVCVTLAEEFLQHTSMSLVSVPALTNVPKAAQNGVCTWGLHSSVPQRDSPFTKGSGEGSAFSPSSCFSSFSFSLLSQLSWCSSLSTFSALAGTLT